MRILLVDDHPLFLDGLKNLLTGRGLEVVGTACNGQEALEQARCLKPDTILMDIEMPILNGITAVGLIKAELPDVHIIILTMSADKDNLFQAVKNGATGYLLKTQATEAFFQQLLLITQGEVPLSSGLAMQLIREFERHDSPDERETQEQLTERQIEVLKLVAAGLTYKEAGMKLFLTERTVKYHMGEILKRLHLKSRAEVLAYSRRKGYNT
jgi:DNA-binding NarL/FixJ family response regulator